MDACSLLKILDKKLPFFVIEEVAKSGYRDNSGIICDGKGDKILFTLDLTEDAVEYAVKNGAGLIVTHHPAIFMPIYKIEGALKVAVENKIGVISVHLPADYAPCGVDYYLAKGLGAEGEVVLENMDGGCGYGRLFEVEEQDLSAFVEVVKSKLNAKNVCVFGENKKIRRVATFCGAGLDENALKSCKDADVVVSADIKHHIILQAVKGGKCVVMPTHYATENYGFKLIARSLSEIISEEVLYFDENMLL